MTAEISDLQRLINFLTITRKEHKKTGYIQKNKNPPGIRLLLYNWDLKHNEAMSSMFL